MKFFFYGIFLQGSTRDSYGITDEPKYDTLPDYVTYGDHIVTAQYQPKRGLSLSGITVDVPEDVVPHLDALEHGYRRVTEVTTLGEQVEVYVSKFNFTEG